MPRTKGRPGDTPRPPVPDGLIAPSVRASPWLPAHFDARASTRTLTRPPGQLRSCPSSGVRLPSPQLAASPLGTLAAVAFTGCGTAPQTFWWGAVRGSTTLGSQTSWHRQTHVPCALGSGSHPAAFLGVLGAPHSAFLTLSFVRAQLKSRLFPEGSASAPAASSPRATLRSI